MEEFPVVLFVMGNEVWSQTFPAVLPRLVAARRPLTRHKKSFFSKNFSRENRRAGVYSMVSTWSETHGVNVSDSMGGATEAFSRISGLTEPATILRRILLRKQGLKELAHPAQNSMDSICPVMSDKQIATAVNRNFHIFHTRNNV